ncbi:hypothetical protein C8Q79DRAFT_957215 [Trametes meyenii]|nr:hypothetical protein C8Q79DRAFT_957215 [Trametes meyenii]
MRFAPQTSAGRAPWRRRASACVCPAASRYQIGPSTATAGTCAPGHRQTMNGEATRT